MSLMAIAEKPCVFGLRQLPLRPNPPIRRYISEMLRDPAQDIVEEPQSYRFDPVREHGLLTRKAPSPYVHRGVPSARLLVDELHSLDVTVTSVHNALRLEEAARIASDRLKATETRARAFRIAGLWGQGLAQYLLLAMLKREQANLHEVQELAELWYDVASPTAQLNANRETDSALTFLIENGLLCLVTKSQEFEITMTDDGKRIAELLESTY